METTHRFHRSDARALPVETESVHLVVTSPPYPLIAMWDEGFGAMAEGFAERLADEDGWGAFEAAHIALDRVWAECARVLVPGGILCVNVGDATRTLGGTFTLYPNHARVLTGAMRAGLSPLPDVLWRKPTNAPNKFMGSGMLPGGAYVTYEHEYVLILRKGDKRTFTPAGKADRARSAYFWEERNVWFSDLWELKGTGQRLGGALRERSAAFPFEVPYRLVNMYSLLGEVVLDPFVGTGTTMAAAMAAGRSSVGVDVAEVEAVVGATLAAGVALGRDRATERLEAHRAFVAGAARAWTHRAEAYGFPVMTSQETAIELWAPERIEGEAPAWRVRHQRAEPVPRLVGGG